MLEIKIKGREFWDPIKEEFINVKDTNLHLEHSLISISKWEAKYKRPFLAQSPAKTEQETKDYILCMSLDKLSDKSILDCITENDYNKILDYIRDPMTATTITDVTNKKKSGHVLTSEEIYYYMTALNIPFSCEKWHLNRLLTLIEVAGIKNAPPKKMSKSAIHQQNAQLNAMRRARMHSKG